MIIKESLITGGLNKGKFPTELKHPDVMPVKEG